MIKNTLILNYLLFALLYLSPSLILGQTKQQLFTEFNNFIEKQTGEYPFSEKKYKKNYFPAEETANGVLKKTNNITLDSIFYIGSNYKRIEESYTYDGKGNMTSIRQNFPKDKIIYQLEFKYDDNSNVIEMRYCFQDTEVEKMTCTLRGEYFYENGKIVRNNLSTVDQKNSKSTIIWKNTYTYDVNNKMEYIDQYMVDSLGNEELIYRDQYIHTANETKLIKNFFNPTGNLDDVYAVTYTYKFNDANYIIEFLETYKVDEGQKNYLKHNFLYNDENQQTETQYFAWNESEGVWIEQGRTFTSYNSEGEISQITHGGIKYEIEYYGNNLIKKIIYRNSSSGNILISNMDEFEYDANDNLVLHKISNWSVTKNDWVKANKTEYSFDLKYDTQPQITFPEPKFFKFSSMVYIEGTLSRYPNALVFEHEIISRNGPTNNEFYNLNRNIGYSYINKLSKVTNYSWNSDAEKWREREIEQYFYSGKTVNVVNSTLTKITFKPNPTQNCFSISMNDLPPNAILKLYNIAGREVFAKEVISEEDIYINKLSKGLYYAKIFEDDIDLELIGKLLIQ